MNSSISFWAAKYWLNILTMTRILMTFLFLKILKHLSKWQVMDESDIFLFFCIFPWLDCNGFNFQMKGKTYKGKLYRYRDLYDHNNFSCEEKEKSITWCSTSNHYKVMKMWLYISKWAVFGNLFASVSGHSQLF